MQPRLLEQIPRFGWSTKTLLDDVVLGDGGGIAPLVSEVFRRPPGMSQAAVLLTVPGGTTSGAGEFGAVLEGSNTGDGTNDLEWFRIASIDLNNQFISPNALDQTRLLGAALPFGSGISFNGSSGNISIGRFAYMRLRAEVRVGTITALAAPTTAPGATITINGMTLTPAGGPRTPGNDDYDNTLGTTGAIAAEIFAALTDVANSFNAEVSSSVSGSVVTVTPRTTAGFFGLTIQSGLPAELEVGPTFDMTAKMTGIAGDGETFVKTANLVSVSGETNTKVSTVIERPAGARYVTATAKLVDAVWDPANASGYQVTLQGAMDRESADAGNFIGIGTEFLLESTSPPPPEGLAALFDPTGGLVVDMGPFNFLRFLVEPSGATPPTDLSTYVIECTAVFDDNDWLNGEQSLTELSSTLQSQFIQVRWGTPGPQIGDEITVPGQLVDMNGVPLPSGNIRRVFLIASDDFFSKENDLHPTATLVSAFSIGSISNTNKILVATNNGEFTVVVDSNGNPGNVYLSAVPYVDSFQSTLFPYSLISSEILTLTFT